MLIAQMQLGHRPPTPPSSSPSLPPNRDEPETCRSSRQAQVDRREHDGPHRLFRQRALHLARVVRGQIEPVVKRLTLIFSPLSAATAGLFTALTGTLIGSLFTCGRRRGRSAAGLRASENETVFLKCDCADYQRNARAFTGIFSCTDRRCRCHALFYLSGRLIFHLTERGCVLKLLCTTDQQR